MHQGGVAKVVQSVAAEDLSSSLEPDSLTELDAAILLQELWGHASKGTKHGLQRTLVHSLTCA